MDFFILDKSLKKFILFVFHYLFIFFFEFVIFFAKFFEVKQFQIEFGFGFLDWVSEFIVQAISNSNRVWICRI